MSARPVLLTPTDIALLRAIEREGSIAAACRRLGISRDRGMYRLARLGRRAPGGVVRTARGGADRGSARLTDTARRWLAEGPEARPVSGGTAVLSGVFRHRPERHVAVRGTPVYVDFVAPEGERVGVTVAPESILVAPARFASSARNVWAGTVRRVRSAGPGGGPERREAVVRALGADLTVALTRRSVERLRVRPGRRLFLYVKATALRRGPATRGSPRR